MVALAGLFEGISAGIMPGAQLGMQFKQMQENRELRELQKEEQKFQMEQLKQKVAAMKLERERIELQEKATPLFYQYMGQKAAEQEAGIQAQPMAPVEPMAPMAEVPMAGTPPRLPPPGVMVGPPPDAMVAAQPPGQRSGMMVGNMAPPPPGVMAVQPPPGPPPPPAGAPTSMPGFLTGGPGNWGAEGTSGFQPGPGSRGKAEPGLQPSDFDNPLSPTGVDNPLAPATPQMLAHGRELANRPEGTGSSKGISGKDFAILLELADKSGNLNELQYYSQQGFLRTPHEILKQEGERVKNQDDTEKMAAFALKYEQAQLDMREQKFRQGMGLKWMKEGKPEAGIAAMGGDWKGAIESAYPKLVGKDGTYKTKIDLVQGAINGDAFAAEALDTLIATEQATGLSVTTQADGSVSVNTAGAAQVPQYPLKDFQNDTLSLSRIRDSLKAIDQLDAIVDQNPTAVGATGYAQKIASGTLSTLGEFFPGALGTKLKDMAKNPNASAAATFESVGENLAMSYASDVWGNKVVTDDDKKGAASVLGLEGGFSTLSAQEAKAKLAVARQKFLEGQQEVAGRRAAFEANAPRTAKARTSWDNLKDKMLKEKGATAPAAPAVQAAPTTTPAAPVERVAPAVAPQLRPATAPAAPAPAAPAPVDQKAIQQRVDSMTPEEKQQRLQQLKRLDELLKKQQGG